MKTSAGALKFDAYHVLPDSPQMQRDFLYVMASLATRSSEAYAADIVRIAKLNGILPVHVDGFQEYPGRGFGGLVTIPGENRPRAILAGSRGFMAESGLQIPAILEVTTREWEQPRDLFVLLAGWDSWVRGVLRFRR